MVTTTNENNNQKKTTDYPQETAAIYIFFYLKFGLTKTGSYNKTKKKHKRNTKQKKT